MTYVDDLHEGNDREPHEPDEHDQQPVDLDEVEQRLERLKFLAPPFGMVATRAELNGTEDLHDLAALVGHEAHGMIAELREARQRIAEWEALPVHEIWALSLDPNTPPEEGAYVFQIEGNAFSYAKRDGKTVWRRRVPLVPWERIDSEPPF